MIFLSCSEHSPYKVYHYRVRSFKQIELDYDDKKLQLPDSIYRTIQKDIQVIYRASTQTFYCYYLRIGAELLNFFTYVCESFRLPGLCELLNRQGNYLIKTHQVNKNCLIYQLDESLSLVGIDSLVKLRELLKRTELTRISVGDSNELKNRMISIFDAQGQWIYLKSGSQEFLFSNFDSFTKLPIYRSLPKPILSKTFNNCTWKYFQVGILELAIYILASIKKDRCSALQLYRNPQLLNQFIEELSIVTLPDRDDTDTIATIMHTKRHCYVSVNHDEHNLHERVLWEYHFAINSSAVMCMNFRDHLCQVLYVPSRVINEMSKSVAQLNAIRVTDGYLQVIDADPTHKAKSSETRHPKYQIITCSTLLLEKYLNRLYILNQLPGLPYKNTLNPNACAFVPRRV
jgi:hypothetical protein